MKFGIKYETYTKDVRYVEILAYSKQHAISKLFGCCEVYFVNTLKA